MTEEKKGFVSLSGRRQLCYHKYSILCILNNRPFEKGKCNKRFLWAALRSVVRRWKAGWSSMDLLFSEECLVVNWSVVEWILCPSSPSPRLTGGEGITSLVNKSSKFIPSCYTFKLMLYSGWSKFILSACWSSSSRWNSMLISLGSCRSTRAHAEVDLVL